MQSINSIGIARISTLVEEEIRTGWLFAAMANWAFSTGVYCIRSKAALFVRIAQSLSSLCFRRIR